MIYIYKRKTYKNKTHTSWTKLCKCHSLKRAAKIISIDQEVPTKSSYMIEIL